MENSENWYGDISKKFESIEESYEDKLLKTLKINLLKRLTKRIADFSHSCSDCEKLKSDVSVYVEKLKNLEGVSKGFRKEYSKSVQRFVSHFQKKHGLVTEGFYTALFMSVGMSIGVAIGLSFGVALDNPAAGLPIGIGAGMTLGIAIGAGKDKKVKDEGKVI